MIVKVQIPLSAKVDHMLVYGKGHVHTVMMDPDEEIIKQIKLTMKGYFEAKWVNGEWKIGKKVATQNW